MTEMRPPVASASRSPGRFGRADQLEDHVEGAVLLEAVLRDRPHPGRERLDGGRLASSRTVATTVAPASAPRSTAAVPTPPAAPCTSSRSPIASPAWVNSASWAVVTFSGMAPACSHGSVAGTGMAARSCTTNRSACPPPASTAITRSPTANRVAPGPERDDLAGGLQAGDVDRGARRRRVEAGALEEVGVADAGRPHRHGDLARARLRVGVLPPLERAVDDRDRVHGAVGYRWPMGDVVADLGAGVELAGPGDLLVLLEELHPVGQPPGGARDGEEHREHLDREAHRLVDEPRVEVDVRVELARDEVVVGERDLLEREGDVEQRVLAGDREDLVGRLLDDRGARVVALVDAVAEALAAGPCRASPPR